MIAKIVRIAVRTPSLAKAWNGSWSPRPSVEKLGDQTRSPTFWMPNTIATTVVTRMLMISAARMRMANSTMVTARPNRKTYCCGSTMGRIVTAGMLP